MPEEKIILKQLLDKSLTLYNQGKYIESIKICKTAFVMFKNLDKQSIGSLYIRLANSYYKLDNIDKYIYYYEEYLKEYPLGQSSVFSRLANAYYYIDCDKSIDYHNKALNMDSNLYDSASKLFAMIKSPYYNQQEIKEEAEYEAERIKNQLYKNIEKFNHEEKIKEKNKKLNIGYLSADCYCHTMMNYILPIWENHNKEEFNFFIFNISSKQDYITEKINNLGFEVYDCSKMNNEQLAKTIYSKEIDILIDIGGYTHLKSYCAFYKPAPIIISYLGYLNTLGIKEFDYILTDEYTIPKEKEYLYTEKPLYLDFGYQIFNTSKIENITNCPFLTNGYITFGSFNCSSKINDTIIYIWCKILEEVQNSKLLIYRTKLTKTIINNLKTKFKQWGIEEDRVIYSNITYSPHYKAYSLADIALDTYPFSGMSIAIETAIMGVGTVTMTGEGMQSRGGGRINKLIGNDDLIAENGQEYIEIAVNLANDKERLISMRKELRNKIYQSSLFNSYQEFTKDFENKLKQAWEKFIVIKSSDISRTL